MPFDVADLKKHPYVIGSVVIVGGVIVFYLLSSSSGSSTSAPSGSSDYASTLAADTQLAQTQAAAQVQTNAQQAQLEQDQLAAQVQNEQTSASLQANDLSVAAQTAAALGSIAGQVQENNSNNYTAITEQANQDVSNENIYGLQESVLADQINAGVEENANNNATALAGTEYVTGAQTTLGLASLSDATTLATQQQSDFEQNVETIIPLAGQQKNSALDATDQTGLFASILSNGNPSVAAGATSASASAAASGNAAGVATVGTVVSGLGSVIKGLFG